MKICKTWHDSNHCHCHNIIHHCGIRGVLKTASTLTMIQKPCALLTWRKKTHFFPNLFIGRGRQQQQFVKMRRDQICVNKGMQSHTHEKVQSVRQRILNAVFSRYFGATSLQSATCVQLALPYASAHKSSTRTRMGQQMKMSGDMFYQEKNCGKRTEKPLFP